MTMAVYVSNTNLLELAGLKSFIEDAFVNDADVTVTLVDAAGEEVAGQTWPTAMDYIVASDGNYRAILKDTLEMVAKAHYVAQIRADAGTDRVGYWEFPVVPKTRTKE